LQLSTYNLQLNKKMEAVAKLNNEPTSPRKMRLLVDLVRGMKVEKALAVLEFNPKHSSVPLRKLILSAISNWKAKNEGADESELIVKTIFVDAARVIKRMRPAPQGRGYRVRKRSNHVTVYVDTAAPVVAKTTKKEVAVEAVAEVKKPAVKKAPAKKKVNSETE
jgi:large subunit ribosomal protein L22